MNMRKEFVVEMRDPLFEEPKKVEVRALSEAKEKKSVEIGSATEPSENHPDHNEDRFTVGHDMLAVYDGMGGSDRGEEHLQKYLQLLRMKIQIKLQYSM
jgi:hypothetical protein